MAKVYFKNILKSKKNAFLLADNRSKILLLFSLSGCGGGGAQQSSQDQNTVVVATNGLDFISPQISYGLDNSGQSGNPYWLNALIMDQVEENGYLNVVKWTNGFKFSFPQAVPSYLSVSERRGWQGVNEEVQSSAKDVFSDLNNLLNITFTEDSDPNANSVIAIMSNQQDKTTGYAYDPLDVVYPTDNYLFSDVFLSTDYLNPVKNDGKTNFDYEVMVHEIGHAIGLRHPFTSYAGDGTLLNPQEENNQWTVMSYDFNEAYFDGGYRMLDMASLVDLYGINPNFNSTSDKYTFQASSGYIILDGGGIDTISAEGQVVHCYIDLRLQAHSYVGTKSSQITAPFQLSVGNAIIENAEGGNGKDWLIGNDQNNILKGRGDDDVIYGGSGNDTIYGGLGNDTIDLTEEGSYQDVIVFEDNLKINGVDKIISFNQGSFNGDVIKFSNYSSSDLSTSIFINPVENINISQKICRVSSESINSTNGLIGELMQGNLKNLTINNESSAIIIGAKDQNLGSEQYIYELDRSDDTMTVTGIALLTGSDLSINNWTEYNII